MTSLAVRLARPEILDSPSLAAAYRKPDRETVSLDLNENPYPPLVTGPLAARLNRYPEPQPARLRATLAALYGVEPAQLLLTRGADDAIDALIRTFCRPGIDKVSICAPTFAAYAHFARLQGASAIEAGLGPGLVFEPARLLAEVSGEANLKLVFLCSPNNPTGLAIDPGRVIEVAGALPDSIVVLDEAYLEFSEVESLAPAAAKRDNLVVLRTLSKAFGLAGARIGCAIGNADLIALAGRTLPPFPLPGPSIEAALAALAPSRRSVHADRIARLRAERDRMAALLAGSPLVTKVHPSDANFLLLEVADPAAAEARLEAAGIDLRFRPDIAPGAVRLTIGTEEENALALAAFGIDAPAPAARRAVKTRDTRETRIAVSVDLDRASPRRIDSGLPFFDHMLDQVAAHGGFSLILACEGDLEIDAHHSIEDCAIAFGQALAAALGDRRGIGRFGFSLPMDEAQAHVLIDLGGRPFSRFEGSFGSSHVGAYPTAMTAHVFRSIADGLGAAIHVRAEGSDDHHKTEACFKAFGRALRQAIARDGSAAIPSTKGAL